jgi:hypothetical protein
MSIGTERRHYDETRTCERGAYFMRLYSYPHAAAAWYVERKQVGQQTSSSPCKLQFVMYRGLFYNFRTCG